MTSPFGDGWMPKSSLDFCWDHTHNDLLEKHFAAARQRIDFEGLPLLTHRTNKFDPNGGSLLDAFAEDKDNEVFSWLLDQGAPWLNPRLSDAYFSSDGSISTTLAALGSVSNLKSLLDRVGDAPLDAVGAHRWNLMHFALKNHHPAMTVFLLDRRPEMLSQMDSFNGLPEAQGDAQNVEAMASLIRAWSARQAAQEALDEVAPLSQARP